MVEETGEHGEGLGQDIGNTDLRAKADYETMFGSRRVCTNVTNPSDRPSPDPKAQERGGRPRSGG